MRISLYALPILAALLAAHPAHAWQMHNPPIAGTSHTLYLNPDVVTSMPDDYAKLVVAANKLDGNASGMRFVLAIDDDLDQSPNNGESEVDFVVGGGSTCGSYACTFRWLNAAGTLVDETDVNFDVLYAWTLTDNKYDSEAYGGPARPLVNTALHEFSHTLGAEHESAYFQIMGEAWTVVSTNGDHTEAAESEDTTTGLESVFGARATPVEDMSAYHWERTGASGAYSVHSRTPLKSAAGVVLASSTCNSEPCYTIAKGTQIQVRQTLENRGNNSHTVKVNWYLSSNSTITTADTLLVSGTVGLNPNEPFTFDQAVTIPSSTASGTYWVGVIVDADGAVAESNEVNNAAYIAQVTVP